MAKKLKQKLVGFYVVGRSEDSGSDELWDITDDRDDMKSFPMYYAIGDRYFKRRLLDAYGTEDVADRVIEAWESGRFVEVKGKNKLVVLEVIDSFLQEYHSFSSNYAYNAARLIVYRLEV